MKIWLRRVFALWLIALGIALFAFEYNNQQSGYTEKEVVYLKIENYLLPEKVKADFPNLDPVELTGPEMNNDDFPCVWWAIYDMDETWTTDTCQVAEWEKVQKIFLNESDKLNLLVFHDMLIRAEKFSGFVVFNYLGEYNIHIKKITAEILSKYPEIKNALDELISTGKKEVVVPVKVWNRFAARNLNPLYDGQCFRYNNKFYGPEFGSDVTEISGEIENLVFIFRILGVVLLMIGLILLRTVYFKKRGIMINPNRIAYLYDFVALLFAVPSAYVLISAWLEKFLFVEPHFYEQELTFMGIFFFIFGIPFLSAFTRRLTSQSVVFSEVGILVDGINRKDFISWESIRSVEYSNEYVLVGRVGTLIPQKLQKSIKIKGDDKVELIINEPQLKSVKRKIGKEVEKNSPDSLKPQFLNLLSDW